MIKYFNDILTVSDNKTGCIVRFGIFTGIIAIYIIGIIEVVKGHEINLLDLAGAIGILLGGGSLGIKLKKDDEPTGT